MCIIYILYVCAIFMKIRTQRHVSANYNNKTPQNATQLNIQIIFNAVCEIAAKQNGTCQSKWNYK